MAADLGRLFGLCYREPIRVPSAEPGGKIGKSVLS